MADPVLARLADCNDVSTFAADGTPGLQPGKRVRGVRCVLEWVARIWLSRAGSLVWDPNTRIDVGDLINADLTPAQLAALPKVLEGEAKTVPLVRTASARVTQDADGNVTITGGVEVFSAGVYPLIVSISGARVALSFPQVRT